MNFDDFKKIYKLECDADEKWQSDINNWFNNTNVRSALTRKVNSFCNKPMSEVDILNELNDEVSRISEIYGSPPPFKFIIKSEFGFIDIQISRKYEMSDFEKNIRKQEDN